MSHHELQLLICGTWRICAAMQGIPSLAALKGLHPWELQAMHAAAHVRAQADAHSIASPPRMTDAHKRKSVRFRAGLTHSVSYYKVREQCMCPCCPASPGIMLLKMYAHDNQV